MYFVNDWVCILLIDLTACLCQVLLNKSVVTLNAFLTCIRAENVFEVCY